MPKARPQTASPIQVIFGAFPEAVRYVGPLMTRVRDIVSPDGDRRDAISMVIRRRLAQRLTFELERVEQHEAKRRARRSRRMADVGAGQQAGAPEDRNANGDAQPGVVLPGLFGLPAPTVAGQFVGDDASTPPAVIVHPHDISLIEVTKDAAVRTRIFPRSVQCQQCEHFLLLAPDHPPPTLQCPCCQRGRLQIEPIIFICARCAQMRELLPPGERMGRGARASRKRRRAEDHLGRPVACPDCGEGHAHLLKHGTNSVARWQWACTRCDHFLEDVQEPCGNCYVPAGDGESGSSIFMQAIPATAPNALQALAHQQMFVGDAEVDVATLRASAERESQRWPDAFALDVQDGIRAAAKGINADGLATLEDASLTAAYLANKVRVFTTVYGYKAGAAAGHPLTPVAAGERLARFFRDPEGMARFLAFCVSTEGAALILEFDPGRIMARLANLDARLVGVSLATAVRAEAAAMSMQEIPALLKVEGTQYSVYRSLHALEHALLSSAMLQIGSEALGSRLFPEAATIVLFEREAIGRGGVVQLVNKGPGLVSLIERARDQMLGCARGCIDGCPTCAYVREAHCNQPVEDLGRTWLPWNSLLSRKGAGLVLSSEAGH